jgi:hypothetical protein
MIAREVDQDQVVIVGGQFVEERPGPVAGAVVDEDDLIGQPQFAADAGQPIVELAHDFLFVVAGDHHGDGRHPAAPGRRVGPAPGRIPEELRRDHRGYLRALVHVRP